MNVLVAISPINHVILFLGFLLFSTSQTASRFHILGFFISFPLRFIPIPTENHMCVPIVFLYAFSTFLAHNLLFLSAFGRVASRTKAAVDAFHVVRILTQTSANILSTDFGKVRVSTHAYVAGDIANVCSVGHCTPTYFIEVQFFDTYADAVFIIKTGAYLKNIWNS